MKEVVLSCFYESRTDKQTQDSSRVNKEQTRFVRLWNTQRVQIQNRKQTVSAQAGAAHDFGETVES